MKRSVKVLIIVAALSLVSTQMFGVTVASTNNNNVTASVTASCRWITPLTMAFGAYDPFAGAALTQSTSVNFKCIRGTAAGNIYKVWFNASGGNMSNGTDNLAFTLTDSANAALPTTALSAVTVAGVAGVAGAGYSYTVNGSVAAGQDVGAGNYQATIVANIEY
jgi:spore coat protein U-like protein